MQDFPWELQNKQGQEGEEKKSIIEEGIGISILKYFNIFFRPHLNI